MKCVPLVFVLTFVAVGTTVAFTQYRRLEVVAPRMMQTKSRRRSYMTATDSYEYSTSSIKELALEDERELLKSLMPPPVDENMTKFQVEFRELLEGILYTKKELSTVLNPRLRAILEGIAASYYEPAVYRAFEVLYEDYIPLRLAGRVVYRELRKVMDESKQYQQSEIAAAMKYTGITRSEIEDCWLTFSQLVNGQQLALNELENYTGPQTLKFVLESGVDSVGSKAKEEGSISFGDLIICLHNYKIRYRGNEKDDATGNVFQTDRVTGNLLQEALNLDGDIDVQKSTRQTLSERRQKFNQRYDDMLVQFSKWKSLIPSGEGRRLDVLKGCFVGSENPAVVEALRIIYVDYSALRLSGDWIFKLVSALMGPIERRHKRRQEKILRP
jgi:hypothetical protein